MIKTKTVEVPKTKAYTKEIKTYICDLCGRESNSNEIFHSKGWGLKGGRKYTHLCAKCLVKAGFKSYKKYLSPSPLDSKEIMYQIKLPLSEIVTINDALRMIMYDSSGEYTQKQRDEAEKVFLKIQTMLDGGI